MTDFKNNCEKRDKRKKQIEELKATALSVLLLIAVAGAHTVYTQL